MIRWIGAALIVGSSLIIGIKRSASLRQRTKKVAALIAFLRNLSAEITYRMTPLPDALRSVQRSVAGELQPFLRTLLEHIERHGGASFCEGLLAACELLDPPERQIVADLAPVLGRYGADEQRTAIDMAMARLDDLLRQAEAQAAQQGRVNITTSVCCGLAAAVILI